jgi:hypothetical protein
MEVKQRERTIRNKYDLEIGKEKEKHIHRYMIEKGKLESERDRKRKNMREKRLPPTSGHPVPSVLPFYKVPKSQTAKKVFEKNWNPYRSAR